MYYKLNEEDCKILSEEEEKRLIVICQYSSDKAERENAEYRLIESNLKMIIKQAAAYGKKAHVDPALLVSYGAEGMKQAIGNFDLSKNLRLLTYAVPWINKKIINGCHKESGVVYFPDYVWDELQLFRSKMQELTKVLGREPSYLPCSVDCGKKYVSELEEILVYSDNAPFTATHYKTIAEAYELQGGMLSLDAEMYGEDKENGKLLDTVKDENQEKRNAADQLHAVLDEELEKLKGSYSDADEIIGVIKKYFFEGKTLASICEETGKTKAQIDCLKKKGLMFLQNSTVLSNYIANI